MSPALARNTFLGFIAGAGSGLAGFIGSAIAARLLGPNGMGALAYTLWCVTIAWTVASLGLPLVLQRFIPNLRAEGNDVEADGLGGVTARLSVLAAFIGSLLLFCWLYWPGSTALQATTRGTRLVLIVLIVAWFVCWRLSDLYLNYLRGEQRFDEFARLTLIAAVIRLALIGVGAWFFGVAGAAGAYVLGYVIPASRIRQMLRKTAAIGKELKREVIRFALTSWIAGVIGGLVFGRTEVAFLEHYASIEAVGIFAAAATLTEMAVLLPPFLLSALLPYFSEQHGLGAHDDMRRLYRTTTGLITLVMAPICIGMAATAPVLVPLLFGAEYARAAPAASVLLLVTAVVGSLGNTTVYLIYSTGKVGLLLISNSVGLLGTVVLGFLLIPRFGIIGAAWSRSAVQVLVVAIEIWYVTRKLKFAPPYRAFGAVLIASLIPGAIAYALSTEMGGILGLVVAVPAAVLVFLVALRVLAVLPMVDPSLIGALIGHAPARLTRLLSCLVKLVAPAARDSSKSD
ncbi:polysaccharide biosynthesis C-terminal domain-containing protein [Mycobacterium sp. NPDC048908]|uniref:oligosaccharide flippase family protein n=1 Tax=Mycobacterium sp. NPDC048908 TaxID=3364292 RepID=UPI003710F921